MGLIRPTRVGFKGSLVKLGVCGFLAWLIPSYLGASPVQYGWRADRVLGVPQGSICISLVDT